MDIHVVTAFKGGSGKTLLSLSILIETGSRIASRQSNEEVWAIDLNSTNPNFYEILDSEGKLTQSETRAVSGWSIRSARSINPNFRVTIARPEKNFQLLGSAGDVWEGLGDLWGELRKSQTGDVACAIVDTDMNVLNLFDDSAPRPEQLTRVISSNDYLYLWNIWMPHYFTDENMHEKVIDVEKLLTSRGVNFCFVNVMNEYLFSRSMREEDDSEESTWQLFLRSIGRSRSADSKDRAAEEMLRLPPAPVISARELLRDWQLGGTHSALYAAEVLLSIYREKGGLPRNIVPMSRQKKRLTNYIRQFRSNRNLRSISDDINGVRKDIATALEKLASEGVRVQ